MEREHRSLILAARGIRPSAAPMFQAPVDGMGSIIDALAARVDIRCNARVARIEPGWRVIAQNEEFRARQVILATPAHLAGELVAMWSAPLADALRAIPYTDSANVSLGYARGRVPHGTGFVVPQGERRGIIAATWASQKFAGRAPPGTLLIRCFMADGPEAAVAQDEVARIHGIREEPLVSETVSWKASSPIYAVGHEARVRAIEERLPPGLHVAGSAYHGVGVPDCIVDARRVAERVAVALRRCEYPATRTLADPSHPA
jgi:oxygen-dependent protoporphyrinogen oxidase